MTQRDREPLANSCTMHALRGKKSIISIAAVDDNSNNDNNNDHKPNYSYIYYPCA